MRGFILSVLVSSVLLAGPTLAQNQDEAALLGELQAKIQNFKAVSAEKTASAREEVRALSTDIRAILDDMKVIYGPDDRRNYFETTVTQNQRLAADATAVLVSRFALSTSDGGKTYSLPSQGARLCATEKFSDEPAPGFCSGFKVADDLIATAGHCIRTQISCDQTSFVFGFGMDAADDQPELSILGENVYQCTEIIDGELGGSDQSDWRVLRVDRPISAPAVQIRTSSMPGITAGAKLTVVGYPMGLPVKIADNASVRGLDAAFLVANLDTYGGNSGSAVFNSAALGTGDLLVEGILVRGEDDFAQLSPCRTSKRCPDAGCRGEDVTYAFKIEGALP